MFASGLFLDSPLVKTFLHIFLEKIVLVPCYLSLSLRMATLHCMMNSIALISFTQKKVHLQKTAIMPYQLKMRFLSVLKPEKNLPGMFHLPTYHGIVQFFLAV